MRTTTGPILWTLVAVLLSGCVSTRKFQEQEALAKRFMEQRDDCREALADLEDDQERLTDELASATERAETAEADLAAMTARADECSDDLAALQAAHDALEADLDQLAAQAGAREADFMARLNEKEDALAAQERALADREAELAAIREGLRAAQERADALERRIQAKDSLVAAIRDKVSEALKGFSSDELTVESRDGKVYVSMSEKLLFETGSYTIDATGGDALEKLADALAKQEDLGVVVEGHTDSIPYLAASGSIRNNWDLSVLRATTVVSKLVDEFGMDPDMVQAAGRGPHDPVADNATADGRSRNRRIEIILSPDLSALWQILEG